jgi:hypothetical protein
MFDEANKFIYLYGLDWAMCGHTEHCTVGVAKNDMAAARLAACYVVGLCH